MKKNKKQKKDKSIPFYAMLLTALLVGAVVYDALDDKKEKK